MGYLDGAATADLEGLFWQSIMSTNPFPDEVLTATPYITDPEVLDPAQGHHQSGNCDTGPDGPPRFAAHCVPH